MYNPILPLPDPIHEENGQFYFWDETWANRHGPFGTKNEATQKLGQYMVQLERGYEFFKESEIHDKEQERAFNINFTMSMFRNFVIFITVFYICFIYRDQLFEFKDSLPSMFQQSFYFIRNWFVDGTNAVRKLLMEVI